MQIHGSTSSENNKWERVAEVTSGYLHVVGSIVSSPPVTVNAGSQSYLFGKSGVDFYPLLSTSGTTGGILRVDSTVNVTTGSESYIKGGSILTYNPIGVGSVLVISSAGSIGVYGNLSTTAGSESYIKGGSIQTYSPLGSTFVLGSVFVTGSINISTTVLPISGIVNQGTSPWGILGSTRLLGVSGADTYALRATSGTSGGYLQIDITNNPVIISGTSTVAGSIYVTGSINIVSPSTIGSFTIQTISGTITIDNRVGGSIVDLPIGSNFTLSSPGSIGVFMTAGSVRLITTTGSIGIYAGVNTIFGISGTIVGVSGIVNQGTTPWVISGTANISGVFIGISGVVNQGTINWGVSGTAFQTIVSTYPVVSQDYSGVTFITTGSKLIWSPTAGSKAQLQAFSISSDVPQHLTIYFSGTAAPANRQIWSNRMPASGTLGMNLYGITCSGPVDAALGAVVNVGGSIDITVWCRSLA